MDNKNNSYDETSYFISDNIDISNTVTAPPPIINPPILPCNDYIEGGYCTKCKKFFIKHSKDKDTLKYLMCRECYDKSRCCKSMFCSIM